MQTFDINVLSLWLIFVLELIIAGILLTERSKTKHFENDYKKELKKAQEELTKILTTTAQDASISVKEVTAVANQTAKNLHDLSGELHKELENSLLTETRNQLKNLENAAKEQIAELNAELIEAVSHTKSEMNTLLLSHAKQATKELDIFKAEQKDQLAAKATEQIQKVTKQYLKNHLSKDEIHELCKGLISDTLEVRTSETKEKE